MENIEKSTLKEQKLLKKNERDSYWSDVFNSSNTYSKTEITNLLKSGWKIMNFSISTCGTQYNTYEVTMVLLEK